MNLKIVLGLVCLMNCGCAVLAPGAAIAHLHRILPISEVTPADVAALKPGSQVQVRCMTTDVQQEFTGTVLKASPQGIALINCVKLATNDTTNPVVKQIPYMNRLFKSVAVDREQVPVQWVSINEIINASELAPPPSNYVPPPIDLNLAGGAPPQRIGVDFDFSLQPDGKVVQLPDVPQIVDVTSEATSEASPEVKREIGKWRPTQHVEPKE